MKRDMDLVRALLLYIEGSPDTDGLMASAIAIDGFPEQVVVYHVTLLHEAGLIDASAVEDLGGINDWIITRLSWPGHDFLDAARNSTVWATTKSKVLSIGGGVTFEVFKELLIVQAKELLGLKG